MKKYFYPSAKTALVLVYLVIVAGALVRMTGSGMGCPDWPKCFGYYIPPTQVEELLWEPGKSFKKGQVIIREEALWVAAENFTTGSRFEDNPWEKYTRHDYAVFNPVHTWTEYINRLFGALAGLACFVMALLSFYHWNRSKKIVLLAWAVVFAMGFQAWLGATVVYSVLNPVKITVHMIMALVIVAMILYIIKASGTTHSTQKEDRLFKKILWLSLLFTLIQIALGTQVRQFVDEQIKMLGYDNMEHILDAPLWDFYAHRSFSILVLLVNGWAYYRNKKMALGYSKQMNWVMILLLLEIISGIAMNYFAFPMGSQTLHLILASLLFGVQYYMILMSYRSGKALV